MLRSTLVFFANSNDCDHFCENCRSKLLCSLKLCNMGVRYFENICFHGTPSLSLKELAFCFMSAYDYMVETIWKISMLSIIFHNLFYKLLRLYSFKVIFMSLRWRKPRKNKSVKNAKPKISAVVNYRKKLVAKTNLSMHMNDIHALFMKKWNNKKVRSMLFTDCK